MEGPTSLADHAANELEMRFGGSITPRQAEGAVAAVGVPDDSSDPDHWIMLAEEWLLETCPEDLPCEQLDAAVEAALQDAGGGGGEESGGGGVSSLDLPATLKLIKAAAFHSCVNLKTLAFAPGSVLETIERNAFTGVGVTSLVLPAGLKTLSHEASV
jgi:hypothetical protein